MKQVFLFFCECVEELRCGLERLGRSGLGRLERSVVKKEKW